MKRLPTDLQVLDAIYKEYYDTFVAYNRTTPNRSAKVYVPIDLKRLADDLKIDGDIVFGRLYYHLEKKYSYKQSDGSIVHFFALKVGNDTHCINFPLAASVLADLRDQARKHSIATWIAVGSLIISIVSMVISLFALKGVELGR
jgi:hypothetical protein